MTLSFATRPRSKSTPINLRMEQERLDGARTVREAAQQVRAFADEIEALAEEGFELQQPVQDDYAFLIRPDDPDPPHAWADD